MTRWLWATLAVLALTGVARAEPAAPAVEVCETRANDTQAKLLACIVGPDLRRHLVAFQKISDTHVAADGHGNRDTGTSGYRASVDYVAGLMRRAGYAVTVQPYAYSASQVVGEPVFATGQRALARHTEWDAAYLSGPGDVTAEIRPLKGSDPETASGCKPEDFAGFPAGAVALLRRGACDLDGAVANAEGAGAAAVAIYNRAPEDEPIHRRHRDGSAYRGALKAQASVPVLAVLANSVGEAFVRQSEAGEKPTVRVVVATASTTGADYNLIAESPHGDPNHVVVVDAHLDSIYGAGILDNASGSATIVEIALKLAHTPTRNRLRYIWFGGEEINLLGSAYYTKTLGAAALAKIRYDVDVDVTATPNYDYLIADPAHAPNVKQFPANVVPQSKPANAAFLEYFKSVGVPVRSASFGNDGTDSNSFSLVGVPNSGILTQQDCCKAAWEVNIWGGERGNYEGVVPSFDGGCVDNPGLWCDNISNTRLSVMLTASRATAAAILTLANAPGR